jgi:hypothetical protein
MIILPYCLEILLHYCFFFQTMQLALLYEGSTSFIFAYYSTLQLLLCEMAAISIVEPLLMYASGMVFYQLQMSL